MNILECWHTYHFKGDFLRHVSGSNPFLHNNIWERRYKQNNMKHQISRQKIVQYLEFFILISHFDLLISQLPDIVQKYFCTPDGAMNPTFQMKYVSAILNVCSWICDSNNLEGIFFGTPCRGLRFKV